MHPVEQDLPFKQTWTTTIFSCGYQSCTWPRSDPFCWQNPCSGCNSGIDLVVLFKYTFFQLCSNAEQISVRLARFRRSYVNYPAVVLINHASFTTYVRCSAQSGHIPFLWSGLSQLIVHLRNLFMLSTPFARIFLPPRWVSGSKDVKWLSINTFIDKY